MARVSAPPSTAASSAISSFASPGSQRDGNDVGICDRTHTSHIAQHTMTGEISPGPRSNGSIPLKTPWQTAFAVLPGAAVARWHCLAARSATAQVVRSFLHRALRPGRMAPPSFPLPGPGSVPSGPGAAFAVQTWRLLLRFVLFPKGAYTGKAG